MLLLLVLAETAVRTAPTPPQVQARATVRIERGATANAGEWKAERGQVRREVVRTGADGRIERLRITDYP